MKPLIVLLMSVFLLGACQTRELKDELAALKKENAELKQDASRKVATIADYHRFVKEVQSNLSEIDRNKELVASLNTEVRSRRELADNIRDHIASIATLMENSELKIRTMNQSLAVLRRDKAENSEEILALEQEIENLTLQIVEMDQQIEALDNELAEIDSLYRMEKSTAMELDDILNRAFFVAGTSSELKKSEIIEKEGGFIGLGRVKVMDATAPDSLFTKIRKDKNFEIPLDSKDAQLITQHPESSYSIAAGMLIISDPDEFWKAGNYLVIELK
jgi:DNA repair exonuclease SbcCD ATPase subunit